MKKFTYLILILTLSVVMVQPTDLLANTSESCGQSKAPSTTLGWIVSDGVVLLLGGAGTIAGVYATAIGGGIAKSSAGDTFSLGFKVIGRILQGGGAAVTLISAGAMVIYFGNKYLVRSSEGAEISREALENQFIDMKTARAAFENDPSNPYLKTAYLTQKMIYKKWLIDVTQ